MMKSRPLGIVNDSTSIEHNTENDSRSQTLHRFKRLLPSSTILMLMALQLAASVKAARPA